MLVSILIGTRNRPALLLRCLESVVSQTYPHLEIVILDDASQPPIQEEKLRQAAGDIPIQCIRAEKQLGLNAVRNQMLKAAAGEIFFIIDDDAFLDNEDALQLIVDAFTSASSIGIIATKILDARGGQIRPLTPHKQKHIKRDPSLLDHPHLTSYFLGGAHAIRRSVIESCGNFDEVLMYGLDEIELAYRTLEEGYHIYYLPGVIVHHQPPPPPQHENRTSDWRLYYLTRNRILFAYKHLPLQYALTYVASWLSWYGYRAVTSGFLKDYFNGIGDSFKAMKQLTRQPIGPKTIAYLKANYGRLWR